jgi:nucleotide-binding universal stress UspA family protein
MSAPELAPDLRRFILTSVPSVPYLEAVLLLRAEPQHRWNTAELARRLYVSERTAGELLAELRAHGIAAGSEEHVQYAPEPGLRDMLDQLAHAYATDLVAVTTLIHSRIDRRAQQFADAFRFRKD